MPIDREPAADESMGMAWWNGLTERARALWLERADSAVPADAWALFKGNPGIALEIGLQEGAELARANPDGAASQSQGLDLYLAPTDPTRH